MCEFNQSINSEKSVSSDTKFYPFRVKLWVSLALDNQILCLFPDSILSREIAIFINLLFKNRFPNRKCSEIQLIVQQFSSDRDLFGRKGGSDMGGHCSKQLDNNVYARSHLSLTQRLIWGVVEEITLSCYLLS